MSGFWSFGNAQLHNQGGSVHMTETIVGPLSRTIVEALPTSVDAAVHAPPPLPSDDLFLQHLHRPRRDFADPYLHCHLRNKEEQSQEEACEYDNDSFCSGSSHGGGADDSGLVGVERAWLSSLVGRHDDPASTATFGSPSSSWLSPSSLATSHHPPHDNEGPLPTLAHSLLAEEDDEGRKLLRRLREERAMLEEPSSSRATTTATSSTQPPPAPTRSSCERSPLRSKVTSTPFQSRDVNALSHQQCNSGTKRSAVAAPPALSPGAASSVSTGGSVTQRSAQSSSSRRSVSSSSIPHSVQQETKRRGEAIAASRKEVEAFSNTIAQQRHAIQEELEHRRAIEAITRLQSSRGGDGKGCRGKGSGSASSHRRAPALRCVCSPFAKSTQSWGSFPKASCERNAGGFVTRHTNSLSALPVTDLFVCWDRVHNDGRWGQSPIFAHGASAIGTRHLSEGVCANTRSARSEARSIPNPTTRPSPVRTASHTQSQRQTRTTPPNADSRRHPMCLRHAKMGPSGATSSKTTTSILWVSAVAKVDAPSLHSRNSMRTSS
jgi:hypothetical protein